MMRFFLKYIFNGFQRPFRASRALKMETIPPLYNLTSCLQFGKVWTQNHQKCRVIIIVFDNTSWPAILIPKPSIFSILLPTYFYVIVNYVIFLVIEIQYIYLIYKWLQSNMVICLVTSMKLMVNITAQFIFPPNKFSYTPSIFSHIFYINLITLKNLISHQKIYVSLLVSTRYILQRILMRI